MKAAAFAALFRRSRAHFSRASGAGLVLVDASCGPSNNCGVRDVAWAVPAERTVYFLRRALRLSRLQLEALILHELGHIEDATPWATGAERRADRIARALTGKEIRYDAKDIQTLGQGGPRPSYLHQ